MDVGTTLAYTDVFLFICVCYLLRRILRNTKPHWKIEPAIEEDELKKKALAAGSTAEQIEVVLFHHRYSGSQWGTKRYVSCYCGQRFVDGDNVDGHKALRFHIAKEIEKLQKP